LAKSLSLTKSLDQQTYRNFEVLIVDQNSDERLLPVLAGHPELPIRHLRSYRGLSRARNVGLKYANGDIVAFPDDDCWYPRDLLESVTHWFSAHREFAGLFVRLRDSEGNAIGPKLPDDACRCTKQNILTVGASPAGFLRRDLVDAIGPFNENIGAGANTPYQAGEECDYFLRALDGRNMWYDPALTVHHPQLHSLERLGRTTYSYALGSAYVLRIHGCHRYYWRLVVRSLGGAVATLCKLDFANSYIYLLRAAGFLRGYFWGPRDLAKLSRSKVQVSQPI